MSNATPKCPEKPATTEPAAATEEELAAIDADLHSMPPWPWLEGCAENQRCKCGTIWDATGAAMVASAEDGDNQGITLSQRQIQRFIAAAPARIERLLAVALVSAKQKRIAEAWEALAKAYWAFSILGGIDCARAEAQSMIAEAKTKLRDLGEDPEWR